MYLTPEFEARMRSLHEQKHATDLKYWLHHILHWHALLAAVMGIVAYGQIQYPQFIQIDPDHQNIEIFAP